MVGTGLVSEEKRRENSAENQREKKRLSVGILWISLVLSLGWQKGSEGGRKLRLYQLLSGLLARSGIRIPPARSTVAEGDKQPARRQAIKASRNRC